MSRKHNLHGSKPIMHQVFFVTKHVENQHGIYFIHNVSSQHSMPNIFFLSKSLKWGILLHPYKHLQVFNYQHFILYTAYNLIIL